MKSKLIFGSLIIFVVIGFFAYYDPLEQNKDIHEKIKYAVEEEKDKPIEAVERLSGVPSKAIIFDDDFIVEDFVVGLSRPTTMSFLGEDILVLEKNYGLVRHIKQGILQENPVLDVEVDNNIERGLLGIASVNSSVYLYFSQSNRDGQSSEANYIYKYHWDGKTLSDPKVMNILPNFFTKHMGGPMAVDLEGNVYSVIGDQTNLYQPIEEYRPLQNSPNGEIDDTGIILRVGLNSSQPIPSLTANPLDHYYAMGIRNSFGLAIDPFTGNLWDTENGEATFDEINLVKPKFNSGWKVLMGPASDEKLSEIRSLPGFTYSDPEFSWEKPVAPTGLVFANSDKFQKFKGDLFVGDCNHGNVYRFTLNNDRTGFVFGDPNLSDLVVNQVKNEDGSMDGESMDEILFGTGFGCITDLEFGPDGSLYVTSITSQSIYRISPR